MFKVKIHLSQIENNYEECLQMYFKVPAIRDDVFAWISDLRKGNLGGTSFKIMK